MKKVTQRLLAWYLSKRLSKEVDRMFGVNKKTNMAATGSLLVALGALGKCFMDGHVDFMCLILGIQGAIVSLGLFHAKDNNVTGGTVTQ